MINYKKKKKFKAELIQNNKTTILHRKKNHTDLLRLLPMYMYIADVYWFFLKGVT